jgi:hypothetical protein
VARRRIVSSSALLRTALLGVAAGVLCSLLTAIPAFAKTVPTWWHPGPAPLHWQWELDHALRLDNASDMGTNDRLPDGQPAPPPTIYDIDGIDNPAKTVSALHLQGDKVICYVEVGAAGNYYTAKAEGLTTTYYQQLKGAGVLGLRLPDYPERFLNIASPKTLAIIESMIKAQCAAKGFDAVETDLDETYAGADGPTGFSLSRHVEVAYMEALAGYMHSLGLAWIAKNPDDTGDRYPTLIAPFADGVLTEQCNEYKTCSALSAFLGTKAVFDAEYSLGTSAFCPTDIAHQIDGVQFTAALDGTRHPCD